MPEIRVVEPHQLSVEEARQRLGGFEEMLAKYRVRLDWQGDRGKLGGVPGVGGDVHVRPNEVEVNVSLSRMVTMMGLDPKKLEATIKRRLGEALREVLPAVLKFAATHGVTCYLVTEPSGAPWSYYFIKPPKE